MDDERKKFIIFLDFDGVIVTTRSHVLSDRTGKIQRTFDPVGIGILNRIHRHHDVKFVLSTSWVRHHQEDTKVMLECAGFQGSFHKDWTTPRKFSSTRTGEIKEWLDDHPEETNYIIIDDDAITDKELKKFHVQTDYHDGILSHNWKQIQDLIKGF